MIESEEEYIAMDYKRGGLQKDYYSEDEVVRRNCPLCNSGDYWNIYKERRSLGIVRCKNCRLIYTNPMVKNSEKNYWGEGKEYHEEARLIFEGLAKHHRDQNYMEDLRIIKNIKPEGNFLDIGTNMGFFLRHALGKKWNVFGIEPSPSLSELARKYFGINMKTAYLGEVDFKDNFFDIVTMTDVFEHTAEPKTMLQQIRRILKNDGIVFIKVPNGNYSLLKFWLAKITKRISDYDIFDSYEHLTHYTQKTLKKILQDCGFRVRGVFIGRPIHPPVWHKYVGCYYQYPSPWVLDKKNYILRILFYRISKFEFLLRFGHIGYFAPNIIMVACKNNF